MGYRPFFWGQDTGAFSILSEDNGDTLAVPGLGGRGSGLGVSWVGENFPDKF